MYTLEGGKMEQILEHTLLYDFYGELLTEHQKSIYEDVYFNDLSYSELASQLGVSRQSVHELIKRCNKILQDYEDKLHLVEKFMRVREQVASIEQLAAEFERSADKKLLHQIRTVSKEIMDTM